MRLERVKEEEEGKGWSVLGVVEFCGCGRCGGGRKEERKGAETRKKVLKERKREVREGKKEA